MPAPWTPFIRNESDVQWFEHYKDSVNEAQILPEELESKFDDFLRSDWQLRMRYCENKKKFGVLFCVFFFVKLIYTKQTRLKKGSWSIPILIFRVLLFEHLSKNLLRLHFFVEKSIFHIISRVLKEFIENIGNTPRMWLKGSQSFSDQTAKLLELDTKRFAPAKFLQVICPRRHKVRNLDRSR